MKPIVLVVSLLAAVAAGAVGGIVASTTAVPAQETIAAPSGTAPAAPTQSAPAAAFVDQSDVQRQITDLTREVDRLHAELAALREGRVRADATEVAQAAPTEDVPAASLAIIHEDAIRRVIAKERAELEQKEEDARKQRELEAALQRAERVAKELGMSTTEQRKLGELYALERDKREEFRKAFQDGQTPDRDQMRQTFQEYRDWRTAELNARFGPDLAARVAESEGDRGGGFRMMGGEGGGAAFGGNNGGGNRRRNNGNGNNNNGGGGGAGGG
jgi:hypothetical protein